MAREIQLLADSLQWLEKKTVTVRQCAMDEKKDHHFQTTCNDRKKKSLLDNVQWLEKDNVRQCAEAGKITVRQRALAGKNTTAVRLLAMAEKRQPLPDNVQ